MSNQINAFCAVPPLIGFTQLSAILSIDFLRSLVFSFFIFLSFFSSSSSSFLSSLCTLHSSHLTNSHTTHQPCLSLLSPPDFSPPSAPRLSPGLLLLPLPASTPVCCLSRSSIFFSSLQSCLEFFLLVLYSLEEKRYRNKEKRKIDNIGRFDSSFLRKKEKQQQHTRGWFIKQRK